MFTKTQIVDRGNGQLSLAAHETKKYRRRN